MTRKPKVSPLVPTVAVDRWLRSVHVATPDQDITYAVEAQIALQTDPRWTPAVKRQTVRYALWRHHKNFAEFAWVMGSH